MKLGNELANAKSFITFNKHTFKKGQRIKYNDRDCVVTGVHDHKNGKLSVGIKDAE